MSHRGCSLKRWRPGVNPSWEAWENHGEIMGKLGNHVEIMGKSCGNHGKIMGIFGRFRKGFLEAKRSQFWGRKNTTWQYVQCLPLMALITFSYTAIHPKSTQKEVPSQVLTNSGSTSAQGICNLSKWGLTDQA
jgi:hypothetical protein